MTKTLAVAAALIGMLSPIAVKAQLPNPTPADKGTTQNLSIQNGSKSSLAFGTNTSFGSSISTQSSPGMTSVVNANFVPLTATISSSIGASPSALGTTKAVISNLKAQGTGDVGIGAGLGGGITEGSITQGDAQYASGNATLEGVGATINLDLKEGASQFSALAAPNTVGYTPSSPLCDLTSATCVFSKEDGSKAYSDQQFANGNATATITSNTTVDIQANQFSSSFAQSF